MSLKSNPHFPMPIPGKPLNLLQLLKIHPGRGLGISRILYRIVLIQEHRRPRIRLKRPAVESRRRIVPQFALKEPVVQILVHQVPPGELAPVARDDGVKPFPRGGGELRFGEGGEPVGLVLRVVPEDVVAADGDAVSFGQGEHGVGEGVVLLALRRLRGVPLHLVLERRDGERPRREPVFVGLVGEDVGVYGGAEGEAWPVWF